MYSVAYTGFVKLVGWKKTAVGENAARPTAWTPNVKRLWLYLVRVQGEVCIQQLPGVVLGLALVDLISGVSDLHVHGPVGHPLVLEALGPARHSGSRLHPATGEARAARAGPTQAEGARGRLDSGASVQDFVSNCREAFTTRLMLEHGGRGQRGRHNQSSDPQSPARWSRFKYPFVLRKTTVSMASTRGAPVPQRAHRDFSLKH